MKKVTVFFSKKLRDIIAKDKEFAKLPVLQYALDLVNYVILMGATKRFPKPSFPIVCPTFSSEPFLLLPKGEPKGESDTLRDVAWYYQKANRIEAHIRPGTVDVCLAIDIHFFPGKKGPGGIILPSYTLRGGVDSTGVRMLEEPYE